MGSNLAKNITKNSKLHVYDPNKNALIKTKKNCNSNLSIHESVYSLTQNMDKPRVIMTLIPHGIPTDVFITQALPQLSNGDTILDFSNEHYSTSNLRHKTCATRGVDYLSVGISGGTLGALEGPALMVGGSLKPHVFSFLDSFSSDLTNVSVEPSSGHFVKMVHNGVEYGMLQGISDIWNFCGQNREHMYKILEGAENSMLSGFLIKNTRDALDMYSIPLISTKCEMNDTGMWCVILALNKKIRAGTITSAIQSRINSTYNVHKYHLDRTSTLSDLIGISVDTLLFVYASTLLEGYSLTSLQNIDKSTSQNAWKGSTIIDCRMLELNTTQLQIILTSTKHSVERCIEYCCKNDIYIPTVTAAYQQYLSVHTHLGTNLLMAQRNLFGNHKI